MANVKLNFSTSVDLTGLNQLKKNLEEIRKMASSAGDNILGDFNYIEVQKTVNAINTLEKALDSAFDTNLNTINIEKFNQHLKNSHLNVQELYTNLNRAGIIGRQSFVGVAQTVSTLGQSIKRTNKLVEEFRQTFENTVKWGISSGLWNTMLSSTQQAYYYVIDLDESLNNIRVVTGKSADEMSRFAKEANKTAKELAVSTKAYTEGALIYYQQGLDSETVKTLTDITAKTSNVTGQSMETVSEQLTAVWNGYQVANQAAKEGMGVYEKYVDKMAAVGAATAADLEELATAMSKVASAANSMGVGFDELSAQIATIVSVTRQAPESVGTALKTIYARLGDLQVDGVDEFGVSLGTVSSQLKTMGVDIMDTNGNMRDMDDVMTEVAEKWNTWTDAQKEAAAVAMAGKRQYNNLIALFDSWGMYEDTLKTSMNAAGTLNKQQEIALESLSNKLDKMTVAAEKFYDALFDEKAIGSMIDGLTAILDMLGGLTESLGGLNTILPILSGLLIKTFSNSIGQGFAKTVSNIKTELSVEENETKRRRLSQELLGNVNSFLTASPEDQAAAVETNKILNNLEQMQPYLTNMSEDRLQEYNLLQQNVAELSKEKLAIRDQVGELAQKNSIMTEYYNILQTITSIEGNDKLSQEEKTRQLEEQKEQQADIVEQLRQQALIISKIDDITVERTGEKELKRSQTYRNTRQASFNSSLEELSNATGGNNQQDILKLMQEQSMDEFLQGFSDDNNKATLAAKAKHDYDLLIKAQDKADDNTKLFAKNYVKNIQKAMKDSGVSTKKNSKFFNDLEKQLSSNIGQYDNLEEAITATSRQLGEQSAEYYKMVNNMENVSSAAEEADEQMRRFKEDMELEQAMSAISSAIGGAVTAFGGIMGAVNAFKVALDSTLPIQERFLGAFSSLLTSIPMIIIGIGQMAKAYSDLTTALHANSLAEAANILLKKGATIITNNNTLAKIANFGASKLEAMGLKLVNKELMLMLGLLGPVTIAIAALAAAVGVVVLFDELTVSAEEARQSLANSIEQYGETKKELDELNTKFEETKERLEELYSIADGDLTIANKQEIAILEAQNAALAAQIELKKQELKLKRDEVIRSGKEAIDKGAFESPDKSFTMGDRSGGFKSYFDTRGIDWQTFQVSDANAYYKQFLIDYEEAIAESEATGSSTVTLNGASMHINTVKGMKKIWDDQVSEYQSKTSALYKEALNALPSFYEGNDNGLLDDQIAKYEARVKEYYESIGQLGNISETIVNSVFSTQEQLDAVIQQAIDKNTGEFNEDNFIETLNKMGVDGQKIFDDLKIKAQTLGLSIYDLLVAADENDVRIHKTKESTDELQKSTAELNREYDELFDRFWSLTQQIELLSNELDNLDRIQSHLHGQELIDSLNKENDLLQEQIDKYNELAIKQQDMAVELANQLRQKYGVEIDSSGYITNYEDAYKNMVASKGKDSQEFQDFEYYIERYIKLRYDEIPKRINEQNDLIYQEFENQMQEREVALNTKLELKESKREWNNFIKDMNKDIHKVYENFDEDFSTALKNYDTYASNKKDSTINTILSEINFVRGEIANFELGTQSNTFVSISEAQNKLKELKQQLMDAAASSKQAWEEAWEAYISSIDQTMERFDSLQEQYDTINEKLEYQAELTELLYGSEAYDKQYHITTAQVEVSAARIKTLQQELAQYEELIKTTKEGDEDHLKYQEKITETQSKLQDQVIEHINFLKNQYTTAFSDSIKTIEDAISGGFGLDKMREEWERIVEYEEKYLDNIEASYAIHSLEYKVNQTLNNTSSLKYQQKIKDVMDEQLKVLKEKETLTQYDFDLAEKRLKVLEAEAALEDAQNAKNAMKLMRGADGNWSYQYVADTSDVEEKQQNLRDAMNDLHEFSESATKESMDNLLQAKENFLAILAEIRDSDVLTVEEKQQAIENLYNQYYNKDNGIITLLYNDYTDKIGDLSDVTAELNGYYGNDATNVVNHLSKVKEDWFNAWNGTNDESVKAIVEKAIADIGTATGNYETQLNDFLDTLPNDMKEGFGDPADDVNGKWKNLRDTLSLVEKKTQEILDDVNNKDTGLGAMKTKVDNVATSWGNVYTNIVNAVLELEKYLTKQSQVKSPPGVEDNTNIGDAPSESKYYSLQGEKNNRDLTVADSRTFDIDKQTFDQEILAKGRDLDIYGNADYTGRGYYSYQGYILSDSEVEALAAELEMLDAYKKREMKTREVVNNSTSVNNNNNNNSNDWWGDFLNWWSKNGGQMIAGEFVRFDTGGYTGEWDSSGRLAMLHQKELVLNASDTENMLEAVKLVRDITSTIGSAIKGNVYSMLVNSIGGLAIGAPWARESNDNAQPNVFNITAEFPNANSVAEIQEAILSLPNLASQYLAENRR